MRAEVQYVVQSIQARIRGRGHQHPHANAHLCMESVSSLSGLRRALVILGVGGGDLPVPVVREAQAAQLLPEPPAVLRGRVPWVGPCRQREYA